MPSLCLGGALQEFTEVSTSCSIGFIKICLGYILYPTYINIPGLSVIYLSPSLEPVQEVEIYHSGSGPGPNSLCRLISLPLNYIGGAL
jgi:hypothetical protein